MFIDNFFRWLTGTKKCKDLKELCNYIKQGDVDHLAHWISQRTWYKADKTRKDEWQSPDTAIKNGECDCEEKALIAAAVIKTWKHWTAEALVIADKDSLKDNHAVCVWWDGTRGDNLKQGIIDNSSVRYCASDLPTLIKKNWPNAKYYMFCNEQGQTISRKIEL